MQLSENRKGFVKVAGRSCCETNASATSSLCRYFHVYFMYFPLLAIKRMYGADAKMMKQCGKVSFELVLPATACMCANGFLFPQLTGSMH